MLKVITVHMKCLKKYKRIFSNKNMKINKKIFKNEFSILLYFYVKTSNKKYNKKMLMINKFMILFITGSFY